MSTAVKFTISLFCVKSKIIPRASRKRIWYIEPAEKLKTLPVFCNRHLKNVSELSKFSP